MAEGRGRFFLAPALPLPLVVRRYYLRLEGSLSALGPSATSRLTWTLSPSAPFLPSVLFTISEPLTVPLRRSPSAEALGAPIDEVRRGPRGGRGDQLVRIVEEAGGARRAGLFRLGRGRRVVPRDALPDQGPRRLIGSSLRAIVFSFCAVERETRRSAGRP